MDAFTLFDLLQEEDLADTFGSQAAHMSSDARHKFHTGQVGQAVKYITSEFSGNDVFGYFVNFECYDEKSPAKSAALISEHFSFDEDIFLAISGVNWGVAIGRGDVDARIPENLAELFLDALPSAVVVWDLGIPEPEWFTPRFNSSAELASGLSMAGYVLDPAVPENDQGLHYVEPYIRELATEGKFTEYVLSGSHDGKPVSVIAQLWIDPLNATGIENKIGLYFGNDGRDEGLAIGDGWCVRLLRKDGDNDLLYADLQVFALDLNNSINELPFETSRIQH